MKKILSLGLIITISLFLTGCGKKDNTIDNSIKGETIEKLQATMTCEGETGQKSCPEAGEEVVVIQTNYGDITMKLFDTQAPQTVTNFKKLIDEDFYDNLIFHRIINGFMIQGGDPDGNGSGGPGYTVPAEIDPDLKHIAGAVATARLGDAANPEKASSGSQFYIVHNDIGASNLDGDYTIFGQVVKGQNIVDAIAQVQTDINDKPVKDVKIETVYLSTF